MVELSDVEALSPEERVRVRHFEELAGRGDTGVPELLDGLTDKSWAVRRHVVAALARLGDRVTGELVRALTTQRESETRIAAVVDTLVASDGDVEALVLPLCKHPEAAIVADAAQILGRRRDRTAVTALAELTAHPDDNVAVAALEALGRIGGRAAVEPVLRAAQSGNFFRTFAAIDVLGRSGDARAVPVLASLLDQPTFALEAARALGRTAEKAATAPLAALLAKPSDGTARVAALALSELEQGYAARFGTPLVIEALLRKANPPGAVRRLIHAATGASVAEQGALCWVLGTLGDREAAPALVKLLDATPSVAAAAAEALKKLERSMDAELLAALREGDSARRLVLLPVFSAHYGAAEQVATCLDDPDATVRSLACETLARLGNPIVVRRLFRCLRDDSPIVVHAAVAAIQSLGSAETEPLALEAARSEDERVQRAGLRIIGYFGYASALPVLLEAMSSGSPRIRETAIEALPFLEHPRAIEALLEAVRHPDPKARAAAARALSQCEREPRTVAYLLRALSDQDAWVRYYACRSLGRLEWEPATEALTRLLHDDAGQVRVAAVEALSHFKNQTALAALEGAARSEEADLRRAAVLGLGIGQWPEAVPVLIEGLDSSDVATRLVAVSALANHQTDAALEALGRAALDGDEAVRNAAIGVLAARPSSEATRLLIPLLQREDTRAQALLALSVPFPGRIAGIVEALSTADDDLSVNLVSALSRMQHPDAQEGLVRTSELGNAAARKAVTSALLAAGTIRTLTALRRMSQDDEDTEVRRVASVTLSQ